MAKVPSNKKQHVTMFQSKVIEHFLSNGGHLTNAVISAGSKASNPSSVGSDMMKKPHVRAYLRDRALELMNTRDVAKAVSKVSTLIESSDDSVALRASIDVLDRMGIRAKDSGNTAAAQGNVNIVIDLTPPEYTGTPKVIDGTHS